MVYFTIYNTSNQNKVHILKRLFEEHQIDHRVLKDLENSAVPVGFKIQVSREQGERAKDILKEHGFLGTPGPLPDAHILSRFWIYLTLALFLIIVISILIKFSGIF